jgi:hypothetical protein
MVKEPDGNGAVKQTTLQRKLLATAKFHLLERASSQPASDTLRSFSPEI